MALRYKHCKNKEGFIAKAKLKHGEKYDYSLVFFPDRGFSALTGKALPAYNANAIVTIICPKHGEYKQRPRKHIEGHGCLGCAAEAISLAQIDRNKTACFLSANDFKELDTHIEIYQTASDGIKRTMLISNEDKDILRWCKWRTTGHQASRKSHTNYAVGQRTNRIASEGLEWLGTHPKLHRLIMSRMLNGEKLDRSLSVDHINHNGLDNRRENLRVATQSQNSANGQKAKTWRGRPVSSAYKGVCKINNEGKWNHGKWHCSIKENGKKLFMGYFDNEEEAARTYDAKAKELHGEYAYLNFPDE